MSLGNDPSRVPPREPPTFDCMHCDGQTHNARRVCPDCALERRGDRR